MRNIRCTFSQLNDVFFEENSIEKICSEDFITSPISRGNYGRIFDIGKKSVVKVCDCNYILYVVPEITILSTFSHACILQATHIFKKNDEIMYVLPKYDCTLKDIFTDNIYIKHDVTVQLCEALNYMHSKYFLHLDLSLKNILVKTGNKRLKVCICDFSLSRFAPKGVIKCEDEKITINYRPYENLLGSTEYSYKSDCWSLGVCLFKFYENKDLINFYYISESRNNSLDFKNCCLFEIQKLSCENNWPPTYNEILRLLLDLNLENRIDTYQLANILNCKTYKKARFNRSKIVQTLKKRSEKSVKTLRLKKICTELVKSLSNDSFEFDQEIHEKAFQIISCNNGILTF